MIIELSTKVLLEMEREQDNQDDHSSFFAHWISVVRRGIEPGEYKCHYMRGAYSDGTRIQKMYLVNHHHNMLSINPALGLDFCGVYETRGTFFNPFKVPVMPCMRFGRFINS